jgi:NAD-dependent deacetylase
MSIVVLTGAGISEESGIKTFRASDGLWEDHSIDQVATPEGFYTNPKLVYKFYNERRRQLISSNIQPNAAHFALADFENKFDRSFLLVTQNIDNLHERAKSKNIKHMHGELLKMRCIKSDQIFTIEDDLDDKARCECCQKIGNLRPHIVWFGEIPLFMDEIDLALKNCDYFIAIGTSGNVYPAAGFYQTAKNAGAHTVELNLKATRSRFNEKIEGKASEIVPEYFKRLLNNYIAI